MRSANFDSLWFYLPSQQHFRSSQQSDNTKVTLAIPSQAQAHCLTTEDCITPQLSSHVVMRGRIKSIKSDVYNVAKKFYFK